MDRSRRYQGGDNIFPNFFIFWMIGQRGKPLMIVCPPDFPVFYWRDSLTDSRDSARNFLIFRNLILPDFQGHPVINISVTPNFLGISNSLNLLFMQLNPDCLVPSSTFLNKNWLCPDETGYTETRENMNRSDFGHHEYAAVYRHLNYIVTESIQRLSEEDSDALMRKNLMEPSFFTDPETHMPQMKTRETGGGAATISSLTSMFGDLMTGGSATSVRTLLEEVSSMGTVSHVFICLFFANNDVLLVQNRKTRTWGFPGGNVERNELAWKAAKREYREEVNAEVPIFGSETGQPRKFHFFHERSKTTTGFYCGTTTTVSFADLLKTFQPSDEIIAIEAFSIWMLQRMIRGEFPDIKLRNCAIESTRELLTTMGFLSQYP